MRLVPLVFAAVVVSAGCTSDGEGNPPLPGADAAPDRMTNDGTTSCNASSDPSLCDGGPPAVDGAADADARADAGDGKSCVDAGGLNQAGCPCTTHGLYQCFGGDGVACFNGVWSHFTDGPCWSRDGDSTCTDEAPGCRCPIFYQRICVNGQGLQCAEGNGRWGYDPASPTCGDGGSPDADGPRDGDQPVVDGAADADAGMDGDGKSCVDAGGLNQAGCPCTTHGLYQCFGGDGVACLNGVWSAFVDGPCWSRDGASTCTDEALGCRCPILYQRICVNGQGLQCAEGNGRWGYDPASPTCGDGGSIDADSATDSTPDASTDGDG